MLREQGLPVVVTWTLAGIWTALRARVWLFDCRAMDVAPFGARGAFLVNLWHGIPLKRIERDITQRDHPCYQAHHGPWWRRAVEAALRPQLTERYDVVLSPGPSATPRFQSAFRTRAVWEEGYPRLDAAWRTTGGPSQAALADDATTDAYCAMRATRDAGYRVVLYAPTFRDYEGADAPWPWPWDELGCMASETRSWWFIKAHPADKRAVPSTMPPNVTWLPAGADLYVCYPLVHIVVTDYSSVGYDVLGLPDVPVVHFAYDLGAYVARARELYEPLDAGCVGPIVGSVDGLWAALAAPGSTLLTGRAELVARHYGSPRSHPQGATGRVIDRVARAIGIDALWAFPVPTDSAR
jgi:CDP-glycerol glycerophosphotransferase (TagB/SpsB family)